MTACLSQSSSKALQDSNNQNAEAQSPGIFVRTLQACSRYCLLESSHVPVEVDMQFVDKETRTQTHVSWLRGPCWFYCLHEFQAEKKRKKSGEHHYKVLCWKLSIFSNWTDVILWGHLLVPKYTLSFPLSASVGKFFPSPSPLPSLYTVNLLFESLHLILSSTQKRRFLKNCPSVA